MRQILFMVFWILSIAMQELYLHIESSAWLMCYGAVAFDLSRSLAAAISESIHARSQS